MVIQESNSQINVLIFGKNGQVAANLISLLNTKPNQFNIKAYSSAEVDFSDLNALSNFLNNLTKIPNFIINAAAYTAVDNCETQQSLADNINHQSVKLIAEFCAKNAVKLIHYSTDYVFDGSGDQPFKENNIDNLSPLNFYGKTKLDAEKAIQNSACDYVILRTSWVYNEQGKNFVNTMIKLLQEKEILNIVGDQIGSPTYAKDIAAHTIEIMGKPFKKGIYHLTNYGYVSWHGFVLEIAKLLKSNGVEVKTKEINAIATKDYKTPAQRPLNSRLDRSELAKDYAIKPRAWQEALQELITK
ncbi:MAG: dTDP-4-dehydrorhamnose reductase [Proteobacteria bacterium]|nr:dTDP-4-dehydrorhamnose reductase [Pseudomonadota bacterium]